MTPSSPATPSTDSVTELDPSYRIPLALMGLALPILGLNRWGGGAVGLFGLFLLIQTLTLRLRFTETALDIYRGDQRIRQFPYADWKYWEIFWSPVPVLFYFREVKSIHFLPILFSPSQLRAALETHCTPAQPQD